MEITVEQLQDIIDSAMIKAMSEAGQPEYKNKEFWELKDIAQAIGMSESSARRITDKPKAPKAVIVGFNTRKWVPKEIMDFIKRDRA